MSHEVETLAYAEGSATPWHKIGKTIKNTTSISEAIEKAGLDWQVRTVPLMAFDEQKVVNGLTVFGSGSYDGQELLPKRALTKVPWKATVRATDNHILGVVGEKYTPLQNDKAFAWFQPFLEAGEATLDVAGSLRQGRHVFILAKIVRAAASIVGSDDVEMYLLLANGHDGSMAVRCGMTPIRVVCANTLAMADESAESKLLRLVHKPDVADTLELVRETINLATKQFEASVEEYRELAKRGIREAEFEAFVKQVFYPKSTKKDRNKEVQRVEDEGAKTLIEKIAPLFEKGRGNDLPGVSGTWWAALNGVSEYLSYARGQSDDIRLDSLWFGSGSVTNRRALKTAKAMVVA
jgi:phage/plasmid-like protein (TIGR03299 family)